MRNMGTDLEELMIMEAMRQSLQDEEERLAREAAAAATTAAAGGSNAAAGQTGEGSASGSSSPSSPAQQNRGRGGLGAQGTAARLGGSTASPATGHSRSSTQSSTVHGGSTPVPPLAPSQSDNGSLESLSDRGVRHDDDSDSDQEDSPALLDNRAIRYTQVNLGTANSGAAAVAGNGSVREGSDLPKHRQAEGPGSRNAPETV